MILTRSKCKAESPLVLAVYMNAAMLVLGLVITLLVWVWGPATELVEVYRFLLGAWAPMGPEQWLAMGLLAAAILAGGIYTGIAYQSAPSSIVSTYDFLYLAFVVIWGVLFFAEVPDTTTIIGIVMIVAAGILAVRR